MRDIRKDLRDRLSQLPEKREKLKRELEALTDSERQLRALLDAEERQYNGGDSQDDDSSQTLGDVIRKEILADSDFHALDEIKERLEGSPALNNKKSPGRQIHFALVGLARGGIVERGADKRWRLRSKRKTG